MAGLKYWIWLSTRRGLDAASALTVLDYFVTPERAYYADREEYDQLPIPPRARAGLCSKELDTADRILADCQRLSLRIMTFRDGDYPERLRQIADPPAVLYARGRMFQFDEEAAIAVVGSRTPSQYGEAAAAKLGMELAAGGALVLSGIAEGLDTCAIKGALKAGGPVVSVLGGFEPFQVQAQGSDSMLSIRSPLRVKYNPTIKYTVELSRGSGDEIGQLKIMTRTQSEALIELLDAFFYQFCQIEQRYIRRFFPEVVPQYQIGQGRLIRNFSLLKKECSNNEIGSAIAAYIQMIDRALKACLGVPAEQWERKIEGIYLEYLKDAPIIC